jgi:DNA-binding response OmpR family regulator
MTECGALEWLNDHSPDTAVLDIALGDGDCVQVAQLLVERSIPFIVFSVRALDEDQYDPIFLEGDWIEKPCASEHVVTALAALSDRSSNMQAEVSFSFLRRLSVSSSAAPRSTHALQDDSKRQKRKLAQRPEPDAYKPASGVH